MLLQVMPGLLTTGGEKLVQDCFPPEVLYVNSKDDNMEEGKEPASLGEETPVSLGIVSPGNVGD